MAAADGDGYLTISEMTDEALVDRYEAMRGRGSSVDLRIVLAELEFRAKHKCSVCGTKATYTWSDRVRSLFRYPIAPRKCHHPTREVMPPRLPRVYKCEVPLNPDWGF